MTGKGTPQRVIRVDEDTWTAYGELCQEKGIARSADLRVYITAQVAEWRRRKRADERAERS